MNMTGFWYHKDFAGEGINIEEIPPNAEHPNGKIFAVFFTLENDVNKYYSCIGERVGTVAVLKAYSVAGNPGSAVEIEVGTVTLAEMITGLRLEVAVPALSRSYTLQRWYTTDPVPGTSISVQKKRYNEPNFIQISKQPGRPWITGSGELYYSTLSADASPPFIFSEYKVTILTGQLTITDIAYGDPLLQKPKVQGAVKGQVFLAGETMHLKFVIEKRQITNHPVSGFKQITWDIFTKELGEPSPRGPQLANLSANIVYGH